MGKAVSVACGAETLDTSIQFLVESLSRFTNGNSNSLYTALQAFIQGKTISAVASLKHNTLSEVFIIFFAILAIGALVGGTFVKDKVIQEMSWTSSLSVMDAFSNDGIPHETSLTSTACKTNTALDCVAVLESLAADISDTGLMLLVIGEASLAQEQITNAHLELGTEIEAFSTIYHVLNAFLLGPVEVFSFLALKSSSDTFARILIKYFTLVACDKGHTLIHRLDKPHTLGTTYAAVSFLVKMVTINTSNAPAMSFVVLEAMTTLYAFMSVSIIVITFTAVEDTLHTTILAGVKAEAITTVL